MKKIFKIMALSLALMMSMQGMSDAECVSTSVKEKVVVGYTTHKKANGDVVQVPIYKTVVVGYDVKCTDVLSGTAYFTRDADGNVYSLDGKKIGENGQVSADIGIIEVYLTSYPK